MRAWQRFRRLWSAETSTNRPCDGHQESWSLYSGGTFAYCCRCGQPWADRSVIASGYDGWENKDGRPADNWREASVEARAAAMRLEPIYGARPWTIDNFTEEVLASPS